MAGFAATFFVPGKPLSKGNHAVRFGGSGTITVVKGRALGTSQGVKYFVGDADGAKLRAWQRAITAAGLGHYPSQPLPGPWTVEAVFFFHRPKKPQDPVCHITRPDGDKLVRAVLDALTGKLWLDDSQVADLVVRKRYAGDDVPGVLVTATCANTQQTLF